LAKSFVVHNCQDKESSKSKRQPSMQADGNMKIFMANSWQKNKSKEKGKGKKRANIFV